MRLTVTQFATAVALLLIGAPLAADAQQPRKVYRIGARCCAGSKAQDTSLTHPGGSSMLEKH